MKMSFSYAVRSNIGLGSKQRNEDSAYASADLLVLTDGMGGHAAGDVASSTVLSIMLSLEDEDLGAEDALENLREKVALANATLNTTTNGHPEQEGMGTTLIAVMRTGTMLAMASIGDSRAYMLRAGEFTQMTTDHSFVQALVDDGRITPEEALHHPQRSLVTRVLTGRENDMPDLSLREAQIGDRFLLCSDGLSDYVNAPTIEAIMTAEMSVEETADALVDIALKASTRDNISVVVAEVVSPDNEAQQQPQIAGAIAALLNNDADELDPADTTIPPNSPAGKAAALSRVMQNQNHGSPSEVSAVAAPADPELTITPPTNQGAAKNNTDTPPARPSTRKWWMSAFAVILLVGALIAGGLVWVQQQFFVGVSSDGATVVIYQGVPDDVGPLRLHKVHTVTDIAVEDLPSFAREQVRGNMTAGNDTEAAQIVENLRLQMVKCLDESPYGSSCSSS